MKQNNYKIGFASLGCPKALVDSERIITRLKAEGYEIAKNYEGAGIVIVNTCGFIEAAIQESLEAIQEALDKNGRVIVTGCLGAKKELIEKTCPNVLAITGAHAYEAVITAVHTHLPPPDSPFIQLLPPEGIKLTPRHYAYLKISEGCNQKCTFCIIPTMRGKLKSYPMNSLLHEAHRLKDAGVQELLVISQDTSAYGVDKRYEAMTWNGVERKTQLYDLSAALGELGIWIRLHYVYPYPHVDHLIPLMRDGLILPYLDIPLQHASQKILKAMKRPANIENTLERIQSWRDICPNITLRSTFIVGFPGETDEDFRMLLDFLKDANLTRVGAFQYSPVQGAKANQLPNPVPETLKAERYHELMSLQATISENVLKKRHGNIETVLIDSVNGSQMIARSVSDAPEIDGLVYLKNEMKFAPGDFVKVQIIDSDAYDLYAKAIN